MKKLFALGALFAATLAGPTRSASADDSDRIAQLEKRLAALESQREEANLLATWKDGLALGTRDGRFLLKFGGRIQHDWSYFRADDALEGAVGSFQDGVEFRRVRFFAAGKVFERYHFKLQMDFTSGSVALNDATIAVKKIPYVGDLQLGHFKEPVGLEALTSSKNSLFIERSLPSALTPGRNSGIMARKGFAEDRFAYAIGVFKDSDKQGKSQRDGNFILTLRLAGLPWYVDSSKYFHLGFSYSHRDTSDETYSIYQRPEAHLAPVMAGFADLAIDQWELFGLEAALGAGRFSAQGELLQAKVDPKSGDSVDPYGYNLSVGVFVTGDHRPYHRSKNAFGRVNPAAALLEGEEASGAGAIQLALRYSFLDLEDEAIAGGTMTDFTLGANWWPNANLRLSLNVIHSDLRHVGKASALVGRIQIDF